MALPFKLPWKIYLENLLNGDTKMHINVDYHVHPNHSIDAKRNATLDSYCLEAVKKNISQICFTTHVDLNPYLEDQLKVIRFSSVQLPTDHESMKRYIDNCEKVRYRYNELKILIGLEIDYSHHYDQLIKDTVPWDMIDYSLVGVHYFKKNESISSCNFTNDKYMEEQIIKEYYYNIEKAIESNMFDAIAHIDLYKKSSGFQLFNLESSLLKHTFRLMNKHNVALEINTRKDSKGDWFPSKRIISMAACEGVKKFSVGSDCHSTDDLGYETSKAIAYAVSQGMTLLDIPKTYCSI